MARKRHLLRGGLLLAAVLGCGRGSPPDSTSRQAPAPPAPAAPARPESVATTLGLEGEAQPVVLHLRWFPALPAAVRFSTYVPPDLVAEGGTQAGEPVRFVAHFAGQRTETAVLQATFYPEGTTEAEARVLARQAAEGRVPVERRAGAAPRFGWSLAEHDFAFDIRPVGWVQGTVALGRHGDRFFELVLQHPESFAEGFVPRAERVLEGWRWDDTGSGL